MSSQDPLLIEIAASRPVNGSVDETTLQSAMDHRLGGVLWTRLLAGELEAQDHVRRRLEELDLAAWARDRMLEDALRALLEAGNRTGVRLVLIKGLSTAKRWYERPTERWSYDLDVVIHPEDLTGLDDLIQQSYPAHPLAGQLVRLAREKHVQSVDLGVNHMPVDLHLDPLKLELVWSKATKRYWDHVTQLRLEDSLEVPTFDDDVSLFLHLVHLNKDHFRRLIGYADVVRGARQEAVTWQVVMDLASREGLTEHVLNTARTVEDEMKVSLGLPAMRRSWRSAAWKRTWSVDTRLSGSGASVHRHRLFVLALTARGRTWAAVGGWLRRLFPPRALLDYYYPGIPGTYVVKLVRARFRRRRNEGSPVTHPSRDFPKSHQ